MQQDIFCQESSTITTPAIFVRGLPQDLLSGKAVNRSKVRIILDEDTDVSGLYPMNESKEMKYQDSISFISEPTDLFYLQTEKMGWTTFERTTGFDLWHRRLGHTPNRFITRLTIDHSIVRSKAVLRMTCKFYGGIPPSSRLACSAPVAFCKYSDILALNGFVQVGSFQGIFSFECLDIN